MVGVTAKTAEGWGGGEGDGAVLFSGLISHIDTYHLYFQCLPYSRVSVWQVCEVMHVDTKRAYLYKSHSCVGACVCLYVRVAYMCPLQWGHNNINVRITLIPLLKIILQTFNIFIKCVLPSEILFKIHL